MEERGRGGGGGTQTTIGRGGGIIYTYDHFVQLKHLDFSHSCSESDEAIPTATKVRAPYHVITHTRSTLSAAAGFTRPLLSHLIP